MGLTPGSGRSPVFLPGESHGQSCLAGYSPWDRRELTEHTETSLGQTRDVESLPPSGLPRGCCGTEQDPGGARSCPGLAMLITAARRGWLGPDSGFELQGWPFSLPNRPGDNEHRPCVPETFLSGRRCVQDPSLASSLPLLSSPAGWSQGDPMPAASPPTATSGHRRHLPQFRSLPRMMAKAFFWHANFPSMSHTQATVTLGPRHEWQ